MKRPAIASKNITMHSVHPTANFYINDAWTVMVKNQIRLTKTSNKACFFPGWSG